MLSEREKTDARRFLGYAAHGADLSGPMSWGFVQAGGTVEYRLNNLSGSEEAVLRGFLATLAGLEQAIPETGAGLDTASAAGWVRNPRELQDRERLFDQWRRRLCAFLGVTPGGRCRAGRPWFWWCEGKMDAATLADRVSRGMGVAARVFGTPYDAYRPRGAGDPLRPELRFLRLPAAFDGGDPGYRRPAGYERAQRGIFDSAYLQVGDLLRGARGVLFVALLPPLDRPICVLTNAVVRASREAGAEEVGLSAYGGVRTARLRSVLSGWPGQLLPGGGGRPGGLPGDGGLGGFWLLLPLGAPALRGSDVVMDDMGRRFVVGTVALSELGWRVSLRQVGA